jgi:uncharacterized DUF497 family protein
MDLGYEVSTSGEDRWSYIGETRHGEVLQVVISFRGKRIRVVTAFEPTRRDKVFYLEHKAREQ